MRTFNVPQPYVKSFAAVSSAIIFGVDWNTPISINISVFYACVIVALAWTQSTRWIWGWTLLCIFLTIAAAASTGPNFKWEDAANRSITVCMLLAAAGFVHFSVQLSRQLDANKRLLAETEARKRTEESLRKAQEELARISRVTTMGELAASIAHEVNQPLSGIVINGNACLRWLAAFETESPNLTEARLATERIIRDGKRAGDVISRLRNLFKKSSSEKVQLDLNELIEGVIILVRNEVETRQVLLRTDLKPSLPKLMGDLVQLQQVMLNLILNGAEAMHSIHDRPRELIVRTKHDFAVRVEVQDAGVGIDPSKLESIFDAFYTTKPGGMGMGLAISRSIIENHGGKLLARANDDHGVTFNFTIPEFAGRVGVAI